MGQPAVQPLFNELTDVAAVPPACFPLTASPSSLPPSLPSPPPPHTWCSSASLRLALYFSSQSYASVSSLRETGQEQAPTYLKFKNLSSDSCDLFASRRLHRPVTSHRPDHLAPASFPHLP